MYYKPCSDSRDPVSLYMVPASTEVLVCYIPPWYVSHSSYPSQHQGCSQLIKAQEANVSAAP